MTKLSPQYQAWRRAGADKICACVGECHIRNIFLAGAEAEHEAAKLVGRIEALIECEQEDFDWAHLKIDQAQARLDALLRGEK